MLDLVDGGLSNVCKYDVGVSKLMFVLTVMQRELVNVLVQVIYDLSSGSGVCYVARCGICARELLQLCCQMRHSAVTQALSSEISES